MAVADWRRDGISNRQVHDRGFLVRGICGNTGRTDKNGMTPVLAIDGGGIRIPYVWTIKGLENGRVLISGGTAYGRGEQFVTRSYNGADLWLHG
jgi:hypothetical protein